MDSVTAQAYGKINLQLLVGQPDANGYHRLESLFQAVNLAETVSLSLADSNSLRWHFDVPSTIAPNYRSERDRKSVEVLPIGSNLAYRAARLIADEVGYTGGLAIEVHKQIPVAGGMAGGSADAAAALIAANQLFRRGLSVGELAERGAALGADVPTCIYGGLNFGYRYGDLIVPLPQPPKRKWVVAVSRQTLSTPAVFQKLAVLRAKNSDETRVERRCLMREYPLPPVHPPRVEELKKQFAAFYADDWQDIARHIENYLHEPAVALLPELHDTLRVACEAGAVTSFVSGSGPSIVALVENNEVREKVAQAWDALPQVSYVLKLESAGENPSLGSFRKEGDE